MVKSYVLLKLLQQRQEGRHRWTGAYDHCNAIKCINHSGCGHVAVMCSHVYAEVHVKLWRTATNGVV